MAGDNSSGENDTTTQGKLGYTYKHFAPNSTSAKMIYISINI